MPRESDPMAELHHIREQIYEKEQGLSPQERLERLHRASATFLKRTGLKLKRVSPPSRAASRS